MMVMHSLGLLQVLVRQIQRGVDHQNAEVRTCEHTYIVYWLSAYEYSSSILSEVPHIGTHPISPSRYYFV